MKLNTNYNKNFNNLRYGPGTCDITIDAILKKAFIF